MQSKPAMTSVPIHDLLAQRWSPRAMDPNKPVEPTQLIAL